MADDNYLPAVSDDAARQQVTARTFYLLGDYFRGTDSAMRYEPSFAGGTVLGPNQSNIDVGVGQGGEIFLRGRSGQVGSSNPTPKNAAPMSLLANPLVLIGLAVGAFLLLRRS